MKSLSRGPSALLTLKLPQELLTRLTQESRTYGISRSALVRQILRSALDRVAAEDAA